MPPTSLMPEWLSAMPNEGGQDFFGFRYLRQTGRKYVLGRAASNQFRCAKTLLIYPAIIAEFRRQNKLPLEHNGNYENLKEPILRKWQYWFQTAHYLYTTYNAYRGNTIDAGFTGSITESANVITPFMEQKETLDIKRRLKAFYGTRPFGYYLQYWISPMGYYNAVLDIRHAVPGKYSEMAWEVMSSNPQWRGFIKAIEAGVVSSATYAQLGNLLDVNKLNEAEIKLVQMMILDKGGFGGEVAREGYLETCKQFKNLFEEYIVSEKEGFGESALSLYTYRSIHCVNQYSSMEGIWRMLCSSFCLETGIVAMLRRALGGSGVLLKSSDVEKVFRQDLVVWRAQNKLHSSKYLDLLKEFRGKKCASWKDIHKTLFEEVEGEENWLDGIVMGGLINESNIFSEQDAFATQAYHNLTGDYYPFNPKHLFANKIQANADFDDAVVSFCLNMLKEQYDYALLRMMMGQVPKYILTPYEESGKFKVEVNFNEIQVFYGIRDFINSTISLWLSAKLFELKTEKLRACYDF
ncbi:MAG: hypothetical protein HZA04_07025 [Nitrospinae bacterium]|nr:hypothetical protein [Nitrospinota bacterium]